MKTLDTHFDIKSLEAEGTFEGYASVFNVLDGDQDRVAPGAFMEAMRKAQEQNRWPKLLWQHDPKAPIGQWLSMKEDDHGLYVKGRLFLEVQRAREAYVLLKNHALDGLSIGYTPLKIKREGTARCLKSVQLHEISLVTFPANARARVQQVKSSPQTTEELWALNREIQNTTKMLKGVGC